MSIDTSQIGNRAWSFAHVLRDDGPSYHAYVEQLTFLLFLKMADALTKPPYSRKPIVPGAYDWSTLLKRDGENLESHYRKALEDMDEVLCLVKNHNLRFLIPYAAGGDHKNYMPDFIVRLDDGHGKDDPLNLIVEVTGQKDGKQGKLKQAKATTARTLWVPAVNNAGTWGRWAFIEITDPWDAQNTIRAFLATAPDTTKGDPHAHAT